MSNFLLQQGKEAEMVDWILSYCELRIIPKIYQHVRSTKTRSPCTFGLPLHCTLKANAIG